jgi:glucose 1-dehydrogenase
MGIREQMSLTGRRALVTGSSQGIGRAIAVGLAEFGADVMIHCARDREKAEEARKEIEAFGVRSGITVADVADPASAARMHAETLDALGGVDILVLNASVQIRRHWAEITPEECRRQLDVNLAGSLWLVQAFAPAMLDRKWGRILTVGSVQQVRPHPDMAIYAASKSALVNLVRNLAKQFASDGVTVNNLAPGVIATGRNEEALADDAYRDNVLAKIPVGYIGEPSDCAAMAVLLCGEAGGYITGQDILVDGGMGSP